MPVVHPCSRQDCGVLTMGEFCLVHEGEAVRTGGLDADKSLRPQIQGTDPTGWGDGATNRSRLDELRLGDGQA
jgi:hypothetical protein